MERASRDACGPTVAPAPARLGLGGLLSRCVFPTRCTASTANRQKGLPPYFPPLLLLPRIASCTWPYATTPSFAHCLLLLTTQSPIAATTDHHFRTFHRRWGR